MERIIEKVKSLIGPEDPHGLAHALRVEKICLKLCEDFPEVDVYALRLAALLHDIGRCKEGDHAKESSRMARQILAQSGFSAELVEKVAKIIEEHSFSGGRKPTSLESMILSDADKLDAIGAVGIARCFMHSGKTGRGLEESLAHFEEKLLKLKDLMYTEKARKIAEKRHEFMVKFLDELRKEINGADL